MSSAGDITIECDGPHWLILTRDLPGIAPGDLLRWFIDPALITRWWGKKATVEPIAGGIWEVRWPAVGWTLRGRIAELTGTSLTVSWTWDHEPDLPARALILRAEATAHGSRLRIIQGPYRQGVAFPHEDEDRASHLDGWQHHVLPALARAIAGVPAP